MTGPVGAAVLTGGESRRMGRDKALIEIGGVPLVVRVAAACRTAGFDPVTAVGGDEAGIRARSVAWAADLDPGQGPLNGILSAFAALPTEVVFVVSVDHPVPDPRAMAATVATLMDHPGTDVVMPVDRSGQRQHLHSAWHRRVLPQLRAAYERGERAPRAVLGSLTLRTIEGLAPEALVDVDTPAEIEPWLRPDPSGQYPRDGDG